MHDAPHYLFHLPSYLTTYVSNKPTAPSSSLQNEHQERHYWTTTTIRYRSQRCSGRNPFAPNWRRVPDREIGNSPIWVETPSQGHSTMYSGLMDGVSMLRKPIVRYVWTNIRIYIIFITLSFILCYAMLRYVTLRYVVLLYCCSIIALLLLYCERLSRRAFFTFLLKHTFKIHRASRNASKMTGVDTTSPIHPPSA